MPLTEDVCFFCDEEADLRVDSSRGRTLWLCQGCGEMASQIIVPLAHPWVDGADVAMWLDERHRDAEVDPYD